MVDITQDDENAGGGDGLGVYANLLADNGQAEDATAGMITYKSNTTEDEPQEGTEQRGLRFRFQEQEGNPERGNTTTDGAKQMLHDEVNVIASYMAGTLEGKRERKVGTFLPAGVTGNEPHAHHGNARHFGTIPTSSPLNSHVSGGELCRE